MNILVVNSVLYIFLLFYCYKKRGCKSISFLISSIWAFCSFMSIIYWNSPFFYYAYNNDLSIVPFIWQFLLFYISLIPILKIDSVPISIDVNNDIVKLLLIIISVSSILPFIENILFLINSFSLEAAFTAKDEGMVVSSKAHLSFISQRLGTISQATIFILPSLLFIYMRRRVTMLIVILSLFSFINVIIFNIINGNRNALFQVSFCVIINYIFLSEGIFSEYKKIIKKIFIFLGGSIVLLFSIITIGRFSSDAHGDIENAGIYSVAWYAGESFINFNMEAWNNVKPLNGTWTFGSLYELLGISNKIPSINIRAYAFYSFFGGLYIDYGMIIPIIIISLVSFILCVLIKRNAINYGLYIVLTLWSLLLINGVFYNMFANYWIELCFTFVIVGIINSLKLPK